MRAVRAGAALLLAMTCAPAPAAMYRCDGNLVTDRAMAGRNCVPLGASGFPKASLPSAAAPAGGSNVTDDSASASSEKAKPYVRPAPVQWTPPPSNVSKLVEALPKDDQGRPILSQNGGAALVLEKQGSRRPTNVLAGCGNWVTRCLKVGERSLDQCFVSVPTCKSADGLSDTQQCCPAACLPSYEGFRRSGQPEMSAFNSALFGKPSCVPGVRDGID